MTREEFESILEECFIEGYNSALEDIEEDILDEEAFDLEGDYDYYSEARNDTFYDKMRKGLVKAGGALQKSLSSNTPEQAKSGKEATKAFLALTGRIKPKHAINAAIKHAERATRPIDKIDMKKPFTSLRNMDKEAYKKNMKNVKELLKGSYNRAKELKKYATSVMNDNDKVMQNHGDRMGDMYRIKGRLHKYKSALDKIDQNRNRIANAIGLPAKMREKFNKLKSNDPD